MRGDPEKFQISVRRETYARLREKAKEDGATMTSVLDDLINKALDDGPKVVVDVDNMQAPTPENCAHNRGRDPVFEYGKINPTGYRCRVCGGSL